MNYSQTHVKASLLFTVACCLLLLSCEQDAVLNSDSEGQVLTDNEEVLLLNSIEAQPIEVPEVAYSFFGENAAFQIEGEGQEVQGMFNVFALAERFPQHQGFQVIEFDDHWQQSCYQYVVPEFVENGSFSLPVRTGRNYVVYADLGLQVNNTYDLFCQIRRIPTVTLEQIPEICTQILCAEQAIQDAQQLQEAVPSLAEHAGELSMGFPFGGLGGIEGAEGVCEGCTAPADNSFIPSVDCYQTGPDCGRGACNLTVDADISFLNDGNFDYDEEEGVYYLTNRFIMSLQRGWEPKQEIAIRFLFNRPVDVSSFTIKDYSPLSYKELELGGFGYDFYIFHRFYSCKDISMSECFKNFWFEDYTKVNMDLDIDDFTDELCDPGEGGRCLYAEVEVRLKGTIRAQCGSYLDGDGDGDPGGDYVETFKIYYDPSRASADE